VLRQFWPRCGNSLARCGGLRLQIEHDNNEKIEKLRADLRVQTDKAQKLLDAGVQKAVLVTRTQFETEFNAYKEIFAILTEVRYAVEQTRPVWQPSSSMSEEEREKRQRDDLNAAYRQLSNAHNRLVVLKDNLCPFYSPLVHAALANCINTSKLEIFQLTTGGQKTFSTPWYLDGQQRQQEFLAAYRQVEGLIRERIASLGVLPQ
jgi:hypothetical protein